MFVGTVERIVSASASALLRNKYEQLLLNVMLAVSWLRLQ